MGVEQYYDLAKVCTTQRCQVLLLLLTSCFTWLLVSLRQSIVAGKARRTHDRGRESTVHVDVEDHDLSDGPIRIFDCAGQVTRALVLRRSAVRSFGVYDDGVYDEEIISMTRKCSSARNDGAKMR